MINFTRLSPFLSIFVFARGEPGNEAKSIPLTQHLHREATSIVGGVSKPPPIVHILFSRCVTRKNAHCFYILVCQSLLMATMYPTLFRLHFAVLNRHDLSWANRWRLHPQKYTPKLWTMCHYSQRQANYWLHVPNASKLPLLLSSTSPLVAHPPQERSDVQCVHAQ